MKRLLPPALVAFLLVAMTVLHFLLPVVSVHDGWWRWLLWSPVALIGAALTLGGSRTFAAVDTNLKTFDDPDQLVVAGIFSVTRNPMYLGFALLLAGVAGLMGSLSPWVGPAGFVASANYWYIPFEEQRLLAVFGDDYRRYQAGVLRWLGRRSSGA